MEGGLDARECTFDYDDAGGRITHVPSDSYFLLEGDPGHYSATAVVGEGPAWPSESFSWAKVDERVRRWAEVEAKDFLITGYGFPITGNWAQLGPQGIYPLYFNLSDVLRHVQGHYQKEKMLRMVKYQAAYKIFFMNFEF